MLGAPDATRQHMWTEYTLNRSHTPTEQSEFTRDLLPRAVWYTSERFASRRSLQDIFMPKLKPNRGAAKRFKKTGTGKAVRRHAFSRHILTSKTRSRKRRLGKSAVADTTNQAEILRMI